MMITLTYHLDFPAARVAKQHLRALQKRFQREFGRRVWFWKLEPQERGAPHFHLLVFGTSFNDVRQFQAWFPDAWNAIAAPGDTWHLRWHRGELGNRPCVETIRTWNGVISYAGKYLGKVCDSDGQAGWDRPGRFWGVFNEDLLPVDQKRYRTTRRAAVSMKRTIRRWLRHTCTGRYRIEDPDPAVPHRRIKRLYLPRMADLLSYVEDGFKCRPYHRRRRSRGGGIRAFVPFEMMQRLLRSWAGHLIEVDDA